MTKKNKVINPSGRKRRICKGKCKLKMYEYDAWFNEKGVCIRCAEKWHKEKVKLYYPLIGSNYPKELM